MQKKGEEISVERSKFFHKKKFGESFKACVSLTEKHNVDKKLKKFQKKIIFQMF